MIGFDTATKPDGSASTVHSLAIAVPPDWIRIPLDQDGFDAVVKGQRRRLAAEHSISKTDLRRLDLTISALRNDLESANVRMLAALVIGVDMAEDDIDSEAETQEEEDEQVSIMNRTTTGVEEAQLLLATAAVSVLSRFDLGSDVPLTPSVLKVVFDLDREPDPDSRIRVANLEDPEIVELPAGKAVKLVQLHTNDNAVSEAAAMFVQQFYVPLDPDGTETALVLFTSPSIEVAQPLSELFDAMMETFEILRDDSEADLDAGEDSDT